MSHYAELPKIPGLPTAEDMQRWRELMRPHIGPGFELVGVQVVEGDTLMAVVTRERGLAA